MRKSLLAAMLLCLATAAAAQTYKYQRPDGSFVYSDKPVPGAKLVDQIPLDRVQTVPSQGAPRPAQPGQQAAPQPQAGPSAMETADAEIKAAQQALDEAKDRLEKGQEPLPGERIGTVSGASRLTEDYFARVQQLEQDVKSAAARLDLANQKRNEAR